MRSVLSALFVATVTAALAQGHANEAPQQLKGLDFLIGNWSGKQNFNNPGAPMVGDITVKVHSFAGRYLEEDLSTVLPARKPTETHHMISFDAKTSLFHAWWFNDTSSIPTELTGSLTGNQLVLMSHPTNPQAPVLKATYDKVSDSSLNYKLEMKVGDAAWQELFHNSYSKAP